MKKYLLFGISVVFACVAAFGVGIGIAHVKIKYFAASQSHVINNTDKFPSLSTTTSENKLALSETIPDALPINAEENITGSDSAPQNIDQPNFTFAVIGDTQSFKANDPNGSLEKAVASIEKQNVNFVLTVGDLVSGCDGGNKCELKYNDWKKTMLPLLDKTYEVMGNHDRTSGDKADAMWQKVFNSLPANGPAGYKKLVYSFDYGNSHFVVLNSEKPKGHIVDKTQQDWLENDLARNKLANIFVLFHEPGYQTSVQKEHGLNAVPKERDALWSILSKYNVSAVFNGHDHIHTRSKHGNTYQIVEGDTNALDDDFPQPGLSEYSYKGKSYMIVSVDGEKVNLKLYTVDGNLLNSFDLPTN